MEDAFVVKSALELVKVRYANMVVEEEDSELSQLVSGLLQTLTSDWQIAVSKINGNQPETGEVG